MYEIVEVGGSATEPAVEVLRRENEDGSFSFIPIDQSNSDYQAYLLWLDENKTIA